MEFRDLPKVDALAGAPELAEFPNSVRTRSARIAIEAMRERIRLGEAPGVAIMLATEAARRIDQTSLRPAINLSGVVLHTGLGRARLAPSVSAHVAKIASNYSLLELDTESGERGDRQEHVRSLLCELTGTEDALVVNNAAAGVLLSLAALAAGGEVVLSRGEMVEIGGSFRMPDIVRQSGCRLVEVGCTNKTHLRDYEEAVGEDTSAILRCNPSNYKVVGFTSTPTMAELRALADERGVWLINDQGSGLLVDSRSLGLSLQSTFYRGARFGDASIASGDKLIGGPQAGIVVGRRKAIEQLARHPLARAVRIDKLSLAALEATLRLWTSGQEEEIPAVRYLRRKEEVVRSLADRLAIAWGDGASVEGGLTEAGSGSAPGTGVPTWRVALRSPLSANELAAALRASDPPIISRIEQGAVWLDPRTLDEDEVEIVEARLRELRG